MADKIVEKNDGIDKEELRKAVAHVKSNDEAENERNIENMIQDDDYKSPWKIKMQQLKQRLTMSWMTQDIRI